MATAYQDKPVIGNGDPVVIAYRNQITNAVETECLGTGFDSLDALENHLQRRSDRFPNSVEEVQVFSVVGECQL